MSTEKAVMQNSPTAIAARPSGIVGGSTVNVNVAKTNISQTLGPIPNTDCNSVVKAMTQPSTGTSGQKSIIEYSLRVPKTNVNPISMMRFNGALNVDITKWANAKMQRDDGGVKTQKSVTVDDELPKFGAGSEYGREAREEARRRKYTPAKKKVNVEDQPWVLKASDKEKVARKFRGVRDGGLTQHASYFIFTQAADGVFEVFPVQSWFNFTSIQKYKCLSAEEAEEEFGRRNKIMNYFSLMVSKRLQSDETIDADGEKGNGKPGLRNKSSSSSLKVSEMDDWDDSDDKEDDSEPEEEGDAKKKKKAPRKNKKKKGSDDEGMEDSDDGDGEGRELDYISDSTDTESEEEAQKKAAQLGVDQESGLKRLLDSDDSSADEERNEDKEEEKEDEPGPSNKDEKSNSEQKDKKKKKKRSKKNKKDGTENLSDDDEEEEKDEKPVDDVDSFIDPADSDNSGSGHNSGDNSPDGTADADSAGIKRKATADIFSGLSPSSKKAKIEMSPSMLQSAAAEGITEDSVRRYLARKPMTATELLQKFKSKKTKISSQDMVNVIAHLLKKINPVKRMQNQKMYLFLSSK